MQYAKPKQWRALEEIHYYFFLIINLPRFQDTSKKNTNIFKQMELFIATRNAEQCRSHHQKKTQKRGVAHVIRKFYQDYYQIRQLDVEHSIKEFRKCLQTINPQFLERKNTKIDKQSLIGEFQKNLQSILQVDRRDPERAIRSRYEIRRNSGVVIREHADQSLQADYQQLRQLQLVIALIFLLLFHTIKALYHAFSFIRFSTKKINSSAQSIVPKCTFQVRLLSNSTPTSMPTSSIKFYDNLLMRKPSYLSFIITFFLGSSKRRIFLLMVKQSLIGTYSLCDFCNLHLKRLFCKISINLRGSPIRSFQWVKLMKGSKVALRFADLHPKPINSASLSLRTEPKVRYHVGTAYNSIQNLSKPLEHSLSLQTRVNLSWNSMIFFCNCQRISPSLDSRPYQAFKILLPQRMVTSSVASNLSTRMIQFSRRSLLSANFSQNFISFCLCDSASPSRFSISFLSSLHASRYMSSTAFKAGNRIFQIQLVSTFKLYTYPVLSSVSSRATFSKDSQMK